MGWKGTVRSVGAAMRAAERDAKRRERERERQLKYELKMAELDHAAREVAEYDDYLERLVSVHKECSDSVDWNEVAQLAAPQEPTNQNNCELKARQKLADYRPNAIGKLFGNRKRVVPRLEAAIEKAIEEDRSNFSSAHERWKSEFADWTESTGIAKRILAGDSAAKMDVIKTLNNFADIKLIGSGLNMKVSDAGVVKAEVSIHGEDVIPKEVKSLLQSGRLSVKQMPKGRFNELFQDHVCSCLIRVANEFFAMLPDEKVYVTATDNLLNTKTGHLEQQPIVSACVSRSTLQSLNLEHVDPSDSLSNFAHNMAFKKTKGFEPIERIDPAQFDG